jgi:hypothetical protein
VISIAACGVANYLAADRLVFRAGRPVPPPGGVR